MTTNNHSVARVALLLGLLVSLTIIGSSAVAVALPQVGRDLGLDASGTAWVLAVFSLSFSVCTAIFGRMADLRGLRRPLCIGVGLLVAGSLAAAAAWSFPSLIAARLLQGAGAGAVPVLAVGVLAARYEGVSRGKALGGLTAVVSIVSGSGPLIGGAITQVLGWRAVLAVPALALLILRPVAALAPATAVGGAPLDWRGAGLVAATATGVVLLLQAPATAAGPAMIGLAVALMIAGAVALRSHVRRYPEGFLPVSVLASRPLLWSAVAAMTLIAAYLGVLFVVPQLFAAEEGWTPLQIGLALLPAAAAGAVASRIVGGTAQRLGRYRVVAALAAASAAGLLVSAVAHANPVLVVVGVIPVVAAFAGGQVALIDGVPALVDHDVRNIALGVFNLIFFTGGAVGAAAAGGLGGTVGLPLTLACLAALPLAGAAAALTVARAQRDRGGVAAAGQGAPAA